MGFDKEFADHIVVMEQLIVIEEGSSKDIYNELKNSITKEFQYNVLKKYEK